MQCKLSLQGKLDTVKQLDDEILELIDDDTAVDEGIEQADIFKEKLQKAIIDATVAIEAKRTGRPPLSSSVIHRAATARRATSPPATVGTEVLGTSALVSTATISVPLIETVSTPLLLIATTPNSSSSELMTAPVLTTTTTITSSGFSTTVPSMSPPELSLPVIPSSTIFSTPSRLLSATTLSMSPGTASRDSPHPGMLADRSSADHTTKVKLPKLSLKRFNGEVTKWSTFWDAFDSSINGNPGLSDIDKFIYLKSLLEGTASEAVSGLKLTAANYAEAVSILRKRFGNKQQIISKHMGNLLDIDSITSQHNLKGLRHLYDTVETQVKWFKILRGPCNNLWHLY